LASLFGSAERAIDKIQEARIAETSREMVVDKDWLVPHYNGELRLQKPPLDLLDDSVEL
jgi:4-amino-4-deoxy-L-arabinose transferase-like glycosyltransferase